MKKTEAMEEIEAAINMAKYRIETATEITGKGEDGRAFWDLELLVKIAEKQLPKQPYLKSWSPARCPSCGEELSEHMGDGYYKHCYSLERCPNPDCGQRLDWETD